MDTHDLLKFIKVGLRSKWRHLTEEDIDKIISGYVHIEEIHIGAEHKPFIRHAITNDELKSGRGENLVGWGADNLHDTKFWIKVSEVIRNFKPKTDVSILVLIMHFDNSDDAAFFALCWK
ncbi:MAG: hypothetical protein HC836_46175 [Richelia sp. RM2_1_2]|nr:hypothetical protein [Richelia sp. RM2_1_2]